MSVKIQRSHLEKKAVVYVRQSSIQQVQHHLESQKRQYGLKERAKILGWEENQIVIIDEDLGISGAHSENRPGYQRLISMLALRQVGIIFGIEVSRLARNCLDWYQLLELSSSFNSLIADEDGIFDPSDFNDRLLLGLKGTISEVELYQIRMRMLRGMVNKARRGELERDLPIGYERDRGKIRKSTNQEVCSSIIRVFDLFKKRRSVRSVLFEFKRIGQEIPYWKRLAGERKIQWRKPRYDSIYAIIKNPIYAGVYVYGRRKQGYDPISKKRFTKVLKKEDIEVFIQDHHEGYITKEEYEENLRILKNNRYTDPNAQGAPREGSALLQGLVFCSYCGFRMRSAYTEGRYSYRCDLGYRQTGEPICGRLSGARLDATVVDLVLNVLNEGTVDLSFNIMKRNKEEKEINKKQWEQKLKRLEYETNLARRRYESVDPENRLVASTLEKEWNESFSVFEEAKTEFNNLFSNKKGSDIAISDVKKALTSLVERWHFQKISLQDKKEIIRCVIEQVMVNTRENEVKVCVVWHGGTITELYLRKRTLTNHNIYNRIVSLSKENTDAEIAKILNEEKILTYKKGKWTIDKVRSFRSANNIKSQFTTDPQLKEVGNFVRIGEIAKKLGVDGNTVWKWIDLGILSRRDRLSNGEPSWIYWDEETEKRLNGSILFDSKIIKIRSMMKGTGMTQEEVIKWAKETNHEILRFKQGEAFFFGMRPISAK